MTITHDMENLQNVELSTRLKTLLWAKDKGLIDPNKKFVQLAKLQEESGELAGALIRNNREEIIDAIGDIRVVLTILAAQLGLDDNECYDTVYDVIKNRTGKLSEDGSFIKD